MKRLLIILLALAIWGCSSDESDDAVGPDLSGPYVTATSPGDGDSTVALDALINVTFSEEIDPLTVTDLSFRLSSSTTGNVNGSITRGSRSASLEPDTNLVYGITYTATITSAITDASGNHMDSNYVWSFTTVYDDFIPLEVGNRWEFLVTTYVDSDSTITYDTIEIVSDTVIQSEQWFIDQDGVLLANRTGGVWRIKPGGQPHLFLKYPGIIGQVYAGDPAISESITIQGTRVQVRSVLNLHNNCYYYISDSDDINERWDYYYEPQLGPVKLVRYELSPTVTKKEQWLFIRFLPAVL